MISGAKRTRGELRPRLGRHGRPGTSRFLLVCFYDPNGIAAVYEGIELWQRLSEFELEILNLWPGRGDWVCLPPSLELSDYDGVIVHAAVSYSYGNLAALDSLLARPFEHYDGIKVLMKQDEQRMSAFFARYLRRKEFDVLLSCVPKPELPKVYPREKVGDIAVVHMLTGYVTEAMRQMVVPWSRSRPIDIGYRGSVQPLSFGRLGFEKRKIGDDVARALARRGGLRLDISSRPQDRINGSGWMDFLAASKATLGVESGSNLFDFDGRIEEWCREFEASHLDMDRLYEDLYRQANAEHLGTFEGNVDYAQVSPRHFEAAAARSVQILYEGRYSDIFVPGEHYLPLRRDLANLEQIVEAIADERRCLEISERAFDEIIHSSCHGYEAFVANVDRALDAALARKGRRRRRPVAKSPIRPRGLILTAIDPELDPRVGWFAESLARDHDVYEIGTYRFDGGRAPSMERVSEHRWRVRVERNRHGSWWIPPASGCAGLSLGRQQLLYLAALLGSAEPVLRSAIGALDALPEDIANFRWLARYLVNSSSSLLEAAQRTGRFDFIVAVDLDALPAGAVLKEETGAALFYDAHEFWPYSFPAMRHWQNEFWAGFSLPLVSAADLAVTVSPPLAKVMTGEYGREFGTLPNCASRADGNGIDVERKLTERQARREVAFLFQGGFAVERGIDRLIAAWQYVDAPGLLLLRGPDNEYRRLMIERARSLDLLGRRVLFPPAVPETDLVSAASEADFGLIPYEPTSINNRLCCPNKLSQYLAAGLPVICNDLDFVKAVVVEHGLGYSVDLADEKAAAGLFNRIIAARSEIPPMARRARAYFEQHFNWEHVFEPLRRDIARVEDASGGRREPSDVDFGWINDPKVMRSLAGEAFQSSAVEAGGTRVGAMLLRAASLYGRFARLRGPGRAKRVATAIKVRVQRALR